MQSWLCRPAECDVSILDTYSRPSPVPSQQPPLHEVPHKRQTPQTASSYDEPHLSVVNEVHYSTPHHIRSRRPQIPRSHMEDVFHSVVGVRPLSSSRRGRSTTPGKTATTDTSLRVGYFHQSGMCASKKGTFSLARRFVSAPWDERALSKKSNVPGPAAYTPVYLAEGNRGRGTAKK